MGDQDDFMAANWKGWVEEDEEPMWRGGEEED